MNVIEELQNGLYSDFIINFNDEDIKTHILMLEKVSDFFKTINKKIFSENNSVKIKHDDLNGYQLKSSIFKNILNIMYKSNLEEYDYFENYSIIDLVEMHRLYDYFLFENLSVTKKMIEHKICEYVLYNLHFYDLGEYNQLFCGYTHKNKDIGIIGRWQCEKCRTVYGHNFNMRKFMDRKMVYGHEHKSKYSKPKKNSIVITHDQYYKKEYLEICCISCNFRDIYKGGEVEINERYVRKILNIEYTLYILEHIYEKCDKEKQNEIFSILLKATQFKKCDIGNFPKKYQTTIKNLL